MRRIITLTLIKADGTQETLNNNQIRSLKRVDGGIELVLDVAPKVTTFYPFHRVWEYEERLELPSQPDYDTLPRAHNWQYGE